MPRHHCGDHCHDEDTNQEKNAATRIKVVEMRLAAAVKTQKTLVEMGMNKATAGYHALQIFELRDLEESDFKDYKAPKNGPPPRRVGGGH